MFKRPLTVIALTALALGFAVFAAARAKDEPKADRDSVAKPQDAKKDSDGKKDEARKRPKPHKDLAPGQAVRIVVDALKNNDEADAGIAVTFDFASPKNQELTGPLKRFIPMLKSPAYAPMLNHKLARHGKVVVDEENNLAETWVTLTDAKDQKVAYVFRLSKQTEGDLKDCWLTDGVMPVDPAKLPEEPKLDDPAGRGKPDEA